MPTSYTWTVASPGSGTSSPSGPGFGTGVEGLPYAFTRRMDASTGDVLFDQERSSWTLGAPVTERVLRCLRTQRGTALRDPSYGVDWSAVDNARAGVAGLATQAIRTALAPFVQRGEVADLEVRAEVQLLAGAGQALVLQLSYRDPRGARVLLSGRRV